MELFAFVRSDADLVRKALADEAWASEALVLRYQRKAFAIARAAGVESGAVDDVVQEALLRAFRNLHELRDPASFGPWLLTIVRNVSRSHLRAHSAAPDSSGLDGLGEPAATEWRDDRALEGKELRDYLWRKVAELPESLREAVFLYYHEEESVRGVARTLGITTGAVKDRLRRGRELLRERLWRELRSELREMLPSTRQWRRMGRQLALIAVASMAPSWVRAAGLAASAAGTAAGTANGAATAATEAAPMTAGAATAAASGTASGIVSGTLGGSALTSSGVTASVSIAKPILGGLLMSGKKVALSLAVAVLLCAGGVTLIVSRSGPRSDRKPGAESGPTTAAQAVAKNGAGRTSGKALNPWPRQGPGEPGEVSGIDEESISIAGRVVSQGRGVEGATIRALNIAAWEAIAEAKPIDPEFHAGLSDRLARLRLAFLREGERVPLSSSGPDGSFRFGRLPEGAHRVVAFREGFLPTSEAVVDVHPGRVTRCEVELTPALRIAGRVLDASGTPVVGAKVEAESAELSALSGMERIERLKTEWIDGTVLFESPPAESGADGAFTLSSLEPCAFDLTARKKGFVDGKAFLVEAGSRDVVLTLSPGSSVTGRVLDPAGKPVEGAAVALSPASVAEVHRLFDWQDVEADTSPTGTVTSTDAAGRFRFEGLLAGHFDLVVSAGGLDARERKTGPEREVPLERQVPVETEAPIETKVPLESAAARGSATTHENSATIEKEIAVPDGPLDLGDLQLPASLEISGTIHDPEGGFISGARVWVPKARRGVHASNRLVSAGSAPEVCTAETRSGADGRFTLVGLSEGRFDVRSSKDGFADGVAANVAAGTDDAFVELRRGLTVCGRVVDGETSEPVSGAEVFVGSPENWRRAESDRQGAFRVTGVVLSALRNEATAVRASHPDYAPYVDYDARLLGRGERSPIIVPLARPERITGRVRDSGGRPVAGARTWVQVTGLSPDTMGYDPARGSHASSALDGSFSLPAPRDLRRMIADVRFHVVAAHPASGRGRVGPLAPPPLGEMWPEVDLTLGGPTIEGRVTADDGSPIAQARVAVRRTALDGETKRREGGSTSSRAEDSGSAALRSADASPDGSWSAASAQGVCAAYTGPDGSYRLSGVEPGPSVLTVTALGFAPRWIPGLEVGTAPQRVDVALSRGGTVEGSVLDASGAPLAQAEVIALPTIAEDAAKDSEDVSEYVQRMALRRAAGTSVARTSSDGRYRLSHLPDGDFRVIARAPGYEAAALFPVRPGATGLEITLHRFSAIVGTVLAAEGREPVPRFAMDILDRKRLPAASRNRVSFLDDYRAASEGELIFRHPAGRFLYDGLRPGNYIVLVQAPGFVAATWEVSLQSGEELPLELLLDRGGRIYGTVLDEESGLPVGDAAVGLSIASVADEPLGRLMSPWGSGALTREDGTFAIEGVREGKYIVIPFHPLYLVGGYTAAEVPGGPDPKIVLKMKPGGRLEGRIRGLPAEGGKRTVRYSLELRRLERSPEETDDPEKMKPSDFRLMMPIWIDSDGRYRAESLEPGSYLVELRRQLQERGETVRIGPTGGLGSLRPVGPEETMPLGRVEIRPRETTVLDAAAPK